MVENPIFISFNLINVFFCLDPISLDHQNPCNLSTDQALLLSIISAEVVRICHYTKKEPLAYQFGMVLKMVAAHQQERRKIGALQLSMDNPQKL